MNFSLSLLRHYVARQAGGGEGEGDRGIPRLERAPDFTPPAMGGDVDLAEAKRQIGDKVCFIGGLDQNRFFTTASPAETRAEVCRCFTEAGPGGGFILSPSDHFFDARPELLHAFADEARGCTC